jgi:transcriptional regulator with XRE-family HTH domain
MIGEALRLMRVFSDLKQGELAEKLGVSKSHISEIENGNKSPSLDLLQRYSSEFNLPISAIMFFAEEIPNAKSGKGFRTKVAENILNILSFIEKKAQADAA